MKYFNWLVISIFVFASLCSCDSTSDTTIVGSEELLTRDMTPDNEYSNFKIDGIVEVTLQQGSNFSVKVTANKNIYDYITVEGSGDVFVIDLASGYNYQNITFNVVITTPDLLSIDVDGVSNCSIVDFDLDHNITLTIDGVSSVDASNSSVYGNLTLSVGGTSKANLKKMNVLDNADIQISGTSNVGVDVSGIIYGSISGVSTLQYRNATISPSFIINDITCSVSSY